MIETIFRCDKCGEQFEIKDLYSVEIRIISIAGSSELIHLCKKHYQEFYSLYYDNYKDGN